MLKTQSLGNWRGDLRDFGHNRTVVEIEQQVSTFLDVRFLLSKTTNRGPGARKSRAKSDFRDSKPSSDSLR